MWIIHVICILGYISAESFTIIYEQLLQPGNSYAHINVTSSLNNNGIERVDFNIRQSTRQNVFINKYPCSTNYCYSNLGLLESVSLSFYNEFYNFIQLFRANIFTNLVFYLDCWQPMLGVTCRMDTTPIYRICVCNGHRSTCTHTIRMLLGRYCQHREPLLTTSAFPTSITKATNNLNTKNMTTPFINATISASWISPITSTTTSPFTTSLKSTSMESTRTSIFSTHFSLKSTPPLSPTHLNTDTTAIRKVATTNIFTQITTRPPSPATTQIPSLKILTDSRVGLNNVSLILNDTYKYSQIRSDLTSDNIQDISTILQNSANLKGLKVEDSRLILMNVDCLLSANQSQIRHSGYAPQKIISIFPVMVQNTIFTQFDYLDGKNLGFIAKGVNCSTTENESGLNDLGNQFDIVDGQKTIQDVINSIVMPLSDICEVTKVSHVFFTIYRNRNMFLGVKQYRSYGNFAVASVKYQRPYLFGNLKSKTNGENLSEIETIFPPSKCKRQISLPLESPVMSATVLNNGEQISQLSNQQGIVSLQFNISHIPHPLHGHFKVTWWDIDKQMWSTEGLCESKKQGHIVLATCKHLTDFTLIIDAALNDPNVCDKVLVNIGYMVNGISLASLLFLLFVNLCGYVPEIVQNRFITYLRKNSLLQRDFVTLSYNTVLLLFYLTFTLFSNEMIAGKACEVFGAISYSLLMGSVLLTIFQTLRTVTMFTPNGLKPFMTVLLQPLSVISISILIPFTISLLLLILTTFFKRNDHFCWVRVDFVIYAIVIPISFLVLNGIFCTILFIYKLFYMKRKFSRSGKHHDNQLRTKIRAIILMQFSIGMPWILQYLTLYSPYTTVWHYIFTIVMGSQGTMMTALFFYKRSQVITSTRRIRCTVASNEGATDI